MESLSRPFHSRKLSNATTFSAKNVYDGVFSGHHRKYAGGSPIDVQDYREIFGSSQVASSIPVLDLSTLGEPTDILSLNLRSSKPDYSTIFGGFRDEDGAVSYEELFGRDKVRAPSSTPPTSQESDYLSHQSSDALKQFNMSYNKISHKSKDGIDGTKHITQLHAVPGFTHFIDEPVPKPKMEAGYVIVDSSKEGESVSEDNVFKTFDIDPKIRPSTVSSPSASPTKSANHKDSPMRSTTTDSESCKTDTFSTYFDEELDANSAASASAAALRKAIEKAQESIRIAKESVSRKKKGLRSFSNKKFKDNMKVEGKLDDITSAASSQVFPDSMDVKKIFVAKKVIDEINGKISQSTKGYSIPVQSCNNFEDNTSSTEITGKTESRPHDSAGKDENATFSSDAVDTETTHNVFVDDYEGKIEEIKTTNGILEHQSVEEKLESVERVDVKESNNLFVSQKVEEEKEVSSIDCSMPVQLFNIFKNNTFVSYSTHVMSETESRPHDSAGKDEYAASSSDEVDTETTNIETSDFVHEDETYNMSEDDYDGKIEEVKTTGVLEDQSAEEEQEAVERVEVDMFRESKEKRDEARLSNAHESVGESNNLSVSSKVENEKEVSQGSNRNDNEDVSNSLENGKHEEVLGQEDVENAENVKIDNEIEEASESKDDHNTEIHKEEETSEMFFDDCELKMQEGVKNCDKSREESEVKPCDDCQMKQEENHTVDGKGESFDESCDQEFDENSSGDDNVVEETDNIDGIHVARNIVDMNDNNVETTQEEEEEFFEKSCVDQTALDEDDSEYEVKSEENDVQSESSSGTTHEYEVKSEENDVQSESSSGTTHGVKILEEESNLHRKNLPDIGSTNEIKISQELQCGNKEDEIEKPGLSTVSGKDHFTRIDDEDVAKEREREKNRLAVERAIREARERAFAEARERAERERAAVEKATQEVRQRMMADALEKVAKSSPGNQSSSEKTSSQSKLRAERAAVERATTEARQRALEKAMSQKIVSELNKSESALRTKAKLEKHNRIMERAAKALAEKEKRDLLAQKEQAERNRLAENLDADIKRWSKGKEGNLRALLSTLQYILGPESGWQPVSLTEIISTSAVKKAYRKATLCVHPDKLQQRGATIQQKYICEKVFDLLKAAWNRFNSEER